MALLLVRYLSSLTWRSSKGVATGALGMVAGDSRANARDIVEDFIRRIEAIVAFKDDGSGRLARENLIEEIERLIRHRMGMGIGEKRVIEKGLTNSYAAGQVNLLNQAVGQGIEKLARIEDMIAGIQVKVLDIEQQSGSGLAADQV